MESHLTAKYQLLRARIESDLASPAVILVTSALPGDGKSVTASGLADSLARVGRRVVLVDDGAASRAFGQSADASETAAFPIVSLPLDARDPSAQSDTIGAFVRGLRKKFEFAIIDGAAFTRSSVPVVLAGLADGVLLTPVLSRSLVRFATVGRAALQRYAATGEPLGKAGAYGVQGRAAAFIERIEGSYSGIMGLPLFETAALLRVARVDF